jgi:hypothetical protein
MQREISKLKTTKTLKQNIIRANLKKSKKKKTIFHAKFPHQKSAVNKFRARYAYQRSPTNSPLIYHPEHSFVSREELRFISRTVGYPAIGTGICWAKTTLKGLYDGQCQILYF